MGFYPAFRASWIALLHNSCTVGACFHFLTIVFFMNTKLCIFHEVLSQTFRYRHISYLMMIVLYVRNLELLARAKSSYPYSLATISCEFLLRKDITSTIDCFIVMTLKYIQCVCCNLRFSLGSKTLDTRSLKKMPVLVLASWKRKICKRNLLNF